MLGLTYLASTLFSFLLPLTPKVVPLIVCFTLVPLVLLLSAGAGWAVWVAASVGWKTPLFFQYGEGTPYSEAVISGLSSGQRYDVFVNLVLPLTDSNLQLGNFMTTLILSNSRNETLAHVQRPAIALVPKSSWFYPHQTTTTLRVPMLESFVTRSANLLARVEVGRRDGWRSIGVGHGREVSMVSASLQGVAIPHGVRGLAIRFPLLTSFGASALFLLVISSIIGFCVLLQMLPTSKEVDEHDPATKSEDTKGTPFTRQRKDARGRRKRSRSIKREPEESEPEPQPMPPADSPVIPLRRRSSKPKIEPEDE